MLKYAVVFAVAGILTTGASDKYGANDRSNAAAGSWQIDTSHSHAQLITDATTNFGKQKINATLGFARVNGEMRVDDGDATKSSIDLEIYPATSMVAPMEDGASIFSQWLGNVENHTLICFHSRNVARTANGQLQATGNLVLNRVHRDIIASNANEGFSGPVYGPPVLYRVSHPATFMFDVAAGSGNAQKDGTLSAAGSTSMYRENFPQLVMTAIRTYWPPVVQQERCTNGGPIESYSGPQCTGTYLKAPPLPQAPHAGNLEDFPGAPNFNAIVGNQLTIQLQLRLSPRGSGQQMASGE